jgi:CDP-diglyceride synthetase
MAFLPAAAEVRVPSDGGVSVCGRLTNDLQIKDISSWLPGHGGFLDRLDSMLPSMAMLYVMFQIFR